MKKRKQAIDVLINRFREHQDDLSIKTLKLNPNTEIYDADMPALVLTNGIDIVIKETARNIRGIPMIRSFTLMAELIINRKNTDLDLIQSVCLMRDILLDQPYPLFLDDGKPDRTTYFRELGIEGPYSYRVAYIEGVKLMIGLIYEDNGTY